MRVVTTAVDAGSATDVGNHRVINEDSLVAEFPLFAVADGMGGHAAGEVASELALVSMGRLAASERVHTEDVLAAIGAANAAIVDRSRDQESARGMGTTLAGLCLGVVGDLPHWFVFNIGDSRVYRLADGLLLQLTKDHSEVEELVAAGQITHDEARTHPNRNVITRSLGTEPAPVPDLWTVPFAAGETYLVCSDGLTTEVDDAQIRDVLSFDTSAQRAAEDLCRRALVAGGHDNISVVVVRMPVESGSDVDVTTAPRSGSASPGL